MAESPTDILRFCVESSASNASSPSDSVPLNLPVIRPGEEPVSRPRATYAQIVHHARIMLRHGMVDPRSPGRQPSPERFVLRSRS